MDQIDIIRNIIEEDLNNDTYEFMIRSLTEEEPEADRGIYETWGGREVTVYNTLKNILSYCISQTALKKIAEVK